MAKTQVYEAVHDRIMEIIPLEIADIWTRNDRKDIEFYLVAVLGIDRQRWDPAEP